MYFSHRPVDWPCSARPVQKVLKFPPRKIEFIFSLLPKNVQKVPQKDSALRPGLYGESYDFFSKIYLPWEVNQKSTLRLPIGHRGYLMPNLEKIHQIVWTLNPNKQTNKQQTGLFYTVHMDSLHVKSSSSNENMGHSSAKLFFFVWVNPVFEKFFLFICGAVDRSGRGKRCSSCSCWGGLFLISHVQFFGV